jgi:ABC-type sugar transport system ATPase subunit
MPEPLVQFESVTKRFPGVLALDGVSFGVQPATVHALVGENGAGKSTLGKILAGIYRPDGGRIVLAGRALSLPSPRRALACGIGMVHQELSFAENLSVAENLCLAELPRRCGLLSRRRMRARAADMLDGIGVTIDVDRRIGELSVAVQQMVQIAQAVAVGAEVIVFDEPTSSLTARETQRLFDLIGRLKGRGVTMLYITHRLAEVFALCDRVTVLRDGRHVATRPVGKIDEDALVRQMIGRPIEEYFPRHLAGEPGRTLLRVERLHSPGKLHDVSFEVRAGEIVGFAGLVGSGRSELAQAIFGLDPAATGRVDVDGRTLPLGSVRAAMRSGVGMVPEDRKRQGLVLMLGGRVNFSLPLLERLRRFGLIDKPRERRRTREFFSRLDVRAPSIDAPVAALSGGNQQKIVLAKWLARRSKVLIVDEPTRGVDVGAKAAIHSLVDGLAQQGLAVLLISSELPEVLNLSTRILVMRGGRVVGELSRDEATQERLLRLMAGVESAAAAG